jgi:hypothetical protein
MKANENKIAFICFHEFFRIGTFQWVTTDSNKKKPTPCLTLVAPNVSNAFLATLSHRRPAFGEGAPSIFRSGANHSTNFRFTQPKTMNRPAVGVSARRKAAFAARSFRSVRRLARERKRTRLTEAQSQVQGFDKSKSIVLECYSKIVFANLRFGLIL